MAFGLALGFVVPLIWRRSHPNLACAAVLPVFLVQLASPQALLYGVSALAQWA